MIASETTPFAIAVPRANPTLMALGPSAVDIQFRQAESYDFTRRLEGHTVLAYMGMDLLPIKLNTCTYLSLSSARFDRLSVLTETGCATSTSQGRFIASFACRPMGHGPVNPFRQLLTL